MAECRALSGYTSCWCGCRAIRELQAFTNLNVIIEFKTKSGVYSFCADVDINIVVKRVGTKGYVVRWVNFC